ncbi:MAG: hypothetical protein KHW59_07040 [Clostridiales bacterium]|nr:hypothetical protein [Clostridiales bacterium]
MLDFNRYFLPDRRIFLDNVQYETLQVTEKAENRKLNCKDTILAQRSERWVKINFNRTLSFTPEGVYRLSVTFGVLLPLNPQTKDEVDWKKVDLAGAFRESCKPLLAALMSRASLLVAQITSASGQNPLITPGAPVTGHGQNP